MNELNRNALRGLVFLTAVLAVSLFVPAWTLAYWQAWLFLAVFFLSTLAITIDLMRRDPMLLARRVHGGPGAERRRQQKIVQGIASIAFIAVLVVPAFDRRFGWSSVPVPIVLAADALVAAGLLIVFFVFRANTFTSATIGVEQTQTVVSSGPYAIVRHPMYAGALVMLAGMPLALGSWWGLLTVLPMLAVLAWRLLDEERVLSHDLAGYDAYRRAVRYRLVPYLW